MRTCACPPPPPALSYQCHPCLPADTSTKGPNAARVSLVQWSTIMNAVVIGTYDGSIRVCRYDLDDTGSGRKDPAPPLTSGVGTILYVPGALPGGERRELF